jgi:DNA-binding MarR family transcriptional regulator
MGDKRWVKTYGISSAEIRVLFALHRSGSGYSRRPTDLFRALLVTSGAITKKVDRLEAAGLVKRGPDPEDKGGSLVHLTAKGKRVADEALESLADATVVSRGKISLSQKDRKLLVKFCEQLLLDFENNPDVNDVFD